MEIRRDFYLDKLIQKKQWADLGNYRYSSMWQILFIE